MKADISMNVVNFQANMEKDYEHDVSYWKTWMARQKGY